MNEYDGKNGNGYQPIAKPAPPKPPPMRCVRDDKPKQSVSIWDAHWFEILAVFIAGWWIGMMMH